MRKVLSYFALPLLLLLRNSSGNPQAPAQGPDAQTGTLERMIVTTGNVTMDLESTRLNGIRPGAQESKRETTRFEVGPNSFFTIRVFNHVLRGPEMGSMGLIRGNSTLLPEALNASSNQLVIERIPPGERYDLAVRDGKTGFPFFNIEGQAYEYDAAARSFRITGGRLLISEELANKLGRPADAGLTIGEISIAATTYPIEILTVVNGAARSSILPPRGGHDPNVPAFVPGPDIIVGDLPSIVQSGSSGTQVGLGVATTSCNAGDQPVHFFQLPNTDHSVVSQNLYRMSGGANNNDRFEQIGQAWVKHTFGADQNNACSFGCTPYPDPSALGVGCSDPYGASENAQYSLLGSRAWVNPFTGVFPSTARNHTGHTHTGTSHRLLVEAADLNTTLNQGATYYAEVQYDTPQEYAWCQANPGQCNMYNNASYRRFNVTGTTSFTFSAVGSTVRMKAATEAWTGATTNTIEPAPGVDGRAFIAYKVTNPSAGVWHYEYAIHNQNLDRSIQSFSVPLGCGITVSNLGFHAPPNHPGFANDGTLGDAGFSNEPWVSNETTDAVSWNTKTFAQDQNANAIRFGTLYNFRFDSNRPPQAANATLGFFKTGDPITVAIQAPVPDPCSPLEIMGVISGMTHGSAGDFGVDLPLTGEPGVECRNGGGNYRIVVTFDNTVVSGNASVTSGIGNVAGSPDFNGNTMTVNLTGVTDTQKVTITLNNVIDSFAQVLPDTAISMNVLIGDTNGNKTVNSADIAQTKGQAGAAATATNFRMDINASGTITASDVSQVKANAGHSVP